MLFGKPRRSRSASSVSSQAQVMLDPGPWPGLPCRKLLHGMPHFLRVGGRQRVAGINGLHGHTTVLCRHLHEVPLCQGERVEDSLGDDNLAPLADAAHSARRCTPLRLDSSARHAFSISSDPLVAIADGTTVRYSVRPAIPGPWFVWTKGIRWRIDAVHGDAFRLGPGQAESYRAPRRNSTGGRAGDFRGFAPHSRRVGGKSVGITLSKKTEALRKPPSQKVMLRIPVDDLDRARSQAARKGVRYQTYIKILLREGLDRQGHLALEVLRGTANGMSTDEILALTRSEEHTSELQSLR